jgi:hypothetical protein
MDNTGSTWWKRDPMMSIFPREMSTGKRDSMWPIVVSFSFSVRAPCIQEIHVVKLHLHDEHFSERDVHWEVTQHVAYC